MYTASPAEKMTFLNPGSEQQHRLSFVQRVAASHYPPFKWKDKTGIMVTPLGVETGKPI